MTLYLETTWIAVGTALGAAAIALVVAILRMVLVLRSRHDRPEVERTLEESDARFEQMLEDLTRELLRAREESQRSRRLASLGGSIDLDSVARRLVEAAVDVPPADAAIVVVSQPGHEPVVATAGMSSEEAEHQLPGGPLDGGETRAVTVNYRYADSHVNVRVQSAMSARSRCSCSTSMTSSRSTTTKATWAATRCWRSWATGFCR